MEASQTVSVFTEGGASANARVTAGDKPIAGLAWIKAARRAARRVVPGFVGITMPAQSPAAPYLWTALAVGRGGTPTPVTIVVR
jgi:hypothetical protein